MNPDEPVTPPAPQHLQTHYTLAEAVRVFFPNGPFTVASLRNEIRKGRLRGTMPAGELLVTEGWLAEWLETCRVQPNDPTSSRNERPSAQPCGLSKTERIEKAQACAAALMTKKLNAPSPDTSPTNTNHRKSLTRSSTKS